jgi:hypothetical protein
MLTAIKFPAIAAAVIAVLAALAASDALAESNKQRPVIVVPYVPPPPPPPPPSPYAPYYYSRWDPNSAYSVYDHLSGGRQQCQLPTEPCDNNHRVTN